MNEFKRIQKNIDKQRIRTKIINGLYVIGFSAIVYWCLIIATDNMK